MAYIGKTPTIGNFQVCDAISVVNGQAAYTMQVGSVNVSPESANHMLVSLNGILQKPGSSYTVSGSTITFASNLVTGDVIDFIQILGNVLDLGVPSDSTVSTAKIVDGAVTSAKLASGTGGKVLQVVQTVKTDTFSTSSATFTDVTGLSVSITPSSASNKILVLGSVTGSVTSSGSGHLRYVRGSTAIGIGDASSSRSQDSVGGIDNGESPADSALSSSFVFLDSPATTSSTTYKAQIHQGDGGGTIFINRSTNDGNDNNNGRYASTITVMEIAG